MSAHATNASFEVADHRNHHAEDRPSDRDAGDREDSPPPQRPAQFTRHAVDQLEKQPDFGLFQRVCAQEARFGQMRFAGITAVAAAVAFDVALSMQRRRVPFLGAAAAASAPHSVERFALLALAFAAAAWTHTGSWYGTHRRHDAALATVLVAHLAASVALTTLLPPTLLAPSVLAARATLAHPWPALVPFAATFPVGLVLFYARFAGSWRRKHIASSPFLVTAPMLMFVTGAVWWYLGLAAARQAPLMPTFTLTVPTGSTGNGTGTATVDLPALAWHALKGAAGVFVSSVPTVAELEGSLLAQARVLYGTLVAHSALLVVALGFSSVVTPPAVDLMADGLRAARRSLPLPSERLVWELAMLVMVVAALFVYLVPCSYLHVVLVGGTLAALLAVGYPADGRSANRVRFEDTDEDANGTDSDDE